VSIGACQKATAVRLELSTNVSCDRTQGVQIFAGKPGTVDGNAPVAEDVRCTNGALGTIVAQPPEDKTATAAFRVVLGVTRPASQCTEADGLAGCIQQRRVLRYIEGETLFLPIVMYERCIGVVCDPSSTCASNGLCVSATITDSAACVPPRVCLPPGDPGTPAVPGTPTEAGADGTLIDGTADGTSPGDGSADVASDNSTFDTGTDAGADTGKDSGADTSTDAPKDAPSDSKKDVGDVPGSGEVVCGASTCVTDEACCTGKLGGGFPYCVESGKSCSPAASHAGRLDCDQSSDCPPGRMCCLVNNLDLQCLAQGVACPTESTACRSNADCVGSLCDTLRVIGRVDVLLCSNPLP
jgi:hypothetical protein